MTQTELPRRYDLESAPTMFHLAPKSGVELTEAQKAAIASRMSEALRDPGPPTGEATAGSLGAGNLGAGNREAGGPEAERG